MPLYGISRRWFKLKTSPTLKKRAEYFLSARFLYELFNRTLNGMYFCP